MPQPSPRHVAPPPAQLAAWRGFLEAHLRVTEQLDRELHDAHDLDLTWYDVLVQLSEAGGRLRMSDLASAVLLSRSNCTRLVDRMMRAGLVRREVDPGDARSRWTVLTAAGRDRLREAAPTHLDGVRRLFADHVDAATAVAMQQAFEAMIQDRDRGD